MAEEGFLSVPRCSAPTGCCSGSGHNRRVQDDDPSIHAETAAFRNAGRQTDYRSTIMATTLSPCWYCCGLVRQFNIGAVVIGDARRTIVWGHPWLADNGVDVTVLDDDRCFDMLNKFIAEKPHLWNEDIGVAENVIATFDISRWHAGGAEADAVAADLDEGLQGAGFILVTGHGIDLKLGAAVRAAAREFFDLPEEVKARYSVAVGGHGWIAPGAEANAYAEGTKSRRTSRRATAWVPKPLSVPRGRPGVVRPEHLARRGATPAVPGESLRRRDAPARRRHAGIDGARSSAAGQPVRRAGHRPTWTMNINHYPPISVVATRARPVPDRPAHRLRHGHDPGPRAGSRWAAESFPTTTAGATRRHDPAALTVNIGDLLEYWSGRRWPSGRHRVLPPQPHAPEEDLVSLIYFYEANHDALVRPLEPPIGRVSGLAPVRCSAFIKERLDAITVT